MTTGPITSSAGGAGGSSTSTGTAELCESQGGTCRPPVAGWQGPAALMSADTCSGGLVQALLGGGVASPQNCPCEVATSPCRSPQLKLHPDDECNLASATTVPVGGFDMCDPVATGTAPVSLLMDSAMSQIAGSCALVTPVPSPIYSQPTSLCTSSSVCTTPGDACVASAGPACLWSAGSGQVCPPGYLGMQQTLNVSSLECGACGLPTGVDCFGDISLYHDSDPTCTAAAITLVISTSCNTLGLLGANFYAQYEPNDLGTCAPALGAVGQAQAYTICCEP